MREIAFITDIHLDEDFPKENGVDARSNWKAILQDVASRNINEIIFGGDIGALSSNKWFFETLDKYNLKIVLGNHDKISEVLNHFENNLLTNRNEWYYTIEEEHLKQIFLDTSTGSVSEIQFEWFRSALRTNKKIMIFIHHPILEINTAVDKIYPLKEREKLQGELLKVENEIIIFCGHCHMIDERAQSNIKQIMTLASSFQIEKDSGEIIVNTESFGYRILKIEKDAFKTELVILNDTVSS